ncbi:MAG: hypothetical protein JKX70_00045 [Phycisphaerales bacterium]|nr:hypothetical protein [Phycisphaerales bacterium]
MKKPNNQLIIRLSPDSLSIAKLKRGKIVQAEQLELDAENWSSVWDDGLMRLDQPLRQLLSRFSSLSGGRATVVYHSPSLTQQVYTFDLPSKAAKEAGIVKIRESISSNDPVQSCVLAESHGDSESTTLLVFSEREEQLRSLFAWLNRCGLTASSFIPESVAVMNVAANTAMSSDPGTAVFYLDSEVSVIAYASNTGLNLIRSAQIGYRKLSEAYSQALRGISKSEDEDDQEQDVLSSLQSTTMLFEHGIPVDTCEVDGIDLRTTVLPVLAPVLQRFCIEIKQSFRFGLAGIEMPKNLLISGPGATIPQIGRAVSSHIEMGFKSDPEMNGFSNTKPFSRGTLEYAMSHSEILPDGLLPEIARDAATRSLLTKSLFAGAAVAALAMGVEYSLTTLELQQVSDQISLQAPQLDAVNDFQSQRERVSTMSLMVQDISKLVSESVVAIPQWDAVLTQLAEITPKLIRIQELRGDYLQNQAFIEVIGLGAGDSEKEVSSEINAFVSNLDRVDGVSSVSLGATSRISLSDNQWGRQFTLKVMLDMNPMPHQAFANAESDMFHGDTP